MTPAPDVTRALQAHQSEKAARGIGEETAELAEETGQDDAGEDVASGVAPASLDGDTAAGQEVSGIILEADGGSVTFLLSNGTDQKVSYGAAFGLERLEEGVWRMVEPIGEIAWEDVLYELSPRRTGRGYRRAVRRIRAAGTREISAGEALFRFGAGGRTAALSRIHRGRPGIKKTFLTSAQLYGRPENP